jgi:hypothetical protein
MMHMEWNISVFAAFAAAAIELRRLEPAFYVCPVTGLQVLLILV